MDQTAIPFLFLRGGTSRGPYFRREDLPQDRERLGEVLVAALGSGHPLTIDGIGGGTAVTTKVAMLSASDDDWAEVDYLFAQVAVEEKLVDFGPTCGNILAGVGPAAIEIGLVAAVEPETKVRIRAVNTGASVEATVQVRDGRPVYGGGAEIAGVPGTAAPVGLDFQGVVGSSTGALLPTGALVEEIDGIALTCMDVAMPVVIARAEAFGLTGHEGREELDANRAFFERMEPIRIEAGRRMGLGDVTKSVIPKFAVVAAPALGGTAAARYFMPWACHPTMAVTGGQCIAACLLTPGTAAEGILAAPNASPAAITLEHAVGTLDVTVKFTPGEAGPEIRSAGLLRTARLLARGEVFVPAEIWTGT
ncbi:MAG: 4-oxalomesaconate tautomerase [Pseudomonadota bacterium]